MKNLNKFALSVLATVIANSLFAQCPSGAPCSGYSPYPRGAANRGCGRGGYSSYYAEPQYNSGSGGWSSSSSNYAPSYGDSYSYRGPRSYSSQEYMQHPGSSYGHDSHYSSGGWGGNYYSEPMTHEGYPMAPEEHPVGNYQHQWNQPSYSQRSYNQPMNVPSNSNYSYYSQKDYNQGTPGYTVSSSSTNQSVWPNDASHSAYDSKSTTFDGATGATGANGSSSTSSSTTNQYRAWR